MTTTIYRPVKYTLNSTTGDWIGSNLITFAYQWTSNSNNISNATSSSYTIRDNADIGSNISFSITATNYSAARNLKQVNGNVIVVVNTIPYNSVLPSISPSNIQTTGTVFTVSNGTWSSASNITYEYQWLRDNVYIIGETSNNYTSSISDDQTILNCIVRATNLWGTSNVYSNTIAYFNLSNVGEELYTIPGTYSWTAPDNVTSISVICIGGGGAGSSGQVATPQTAGGGGGLGWKNNIAVVPGNSYTVVVGLGGVNSTNNHGNGAAGSDSYFISLATVAGYGGAAGGGGVWGTNGPNTGSGGSWTGDGGGYGGRGGFTSINFTNGSGGDVGGGGGGAGGYSANGGAGAYFESGRPLNTRTARFADGGGGGGGEVASGMSGGIGTAAGGNGGGGVLYLGQGSDGITALIGGGFGGSGGANGLVASTSGGPEPGAPGGLYGGGGGSGAQRAGIASNQKGGNGANGAVRIMWGPNRAFPITNVGSTL